MALLEGVLELLDGCLLVVEDSFGASFSPVWPYEYSYKGVAGNVEIVDGSGEVVARVGERVGVSGSEFGPVGYAEIENMSLAI